MDTGGIGLLRREKSDDIIIKAALEQVDLAIESSTVIILVVNVQEGVVPLDREAAARLRRSGKPVLVAANKADNARAETGADDFAELGFEKIFPVSAIHGLGVEDLLNTVGIFRLDEGGQIASRMQVKLGRASVNSVEILSGLQPGDKVILSDMSQWDAFNRIRLD